MPIFISYSHQDKEFVDQLAAQLVRNRVYIWLDRWELHVGDSITFRIEDAITNAGALLVILSRASVESPWCRREMNGGLVRELEERRVVVLPVLVEDCTVPLFLRDKLYADFRSNFDDGLRTIIEATARISNPNTGRIEAPTFHVDWSLDWAETTESILFRLTLIQEAVDDQFTILSIVTILSDREGHENYRRLLVAEDPETANTAAISLVVSTMTESDDLRILLNDQFEHVESYFCATDSGTYKVVISSRRLGPDNGRSVIYDLAPPLQDLTEKMRSVMERPSSSPRR
jgi:hypothetical protein